MRMNVYRRLLNVVAAAATIAINFLANALPLGGQTTGEISDRFPVYFVPAGYVFSIWGLIYLGMAAFSIYQVLPGQGRNSRVSGIGNLFFISCVANSAWIVLWHYELLYGTLAVMLLLLLSLIAIYLRLGIGRAKVLTAEKWLVDIPFSVYLSWIAVATIANATVVLYDSGWSGWGLSSEAWTVIMLVAAALIACLVAISREDLAYTLVAIWALVGIAVKNSTTPAIATAALASAALCAVVFALRARLLSRQQRTI